MVGHQSWKQGTSLAVGRNHRDGGTIRSYTGTPNNMSVTERAPPQRQQSPRRGQRNVTPYERAPSPQARYRNASPQREAPVQNSANFDSSVQHRSPSPQRRYAQAQESPLPVRDEREISRHKYDKSYAQSQKQMQLSRLEAENYEVKYKLQEMELEVKKHKKAAELATEKCDRQKCEAELLKQAFEAAKLVAIAEAVKEFKEREDFKKVEKLEHENQQLKEQLVARSSQLSVEISKYDALNGEYQNEKRARLALNADYLVLKNQAVGVITSHHKHSHSDSDDGGFEVECEVEVKAPKMPSVECEIEVKMPGVEIEFGM